jgi:hypothetical protein
MSYRVTVLELEPTATCNIQAVRLATFSEGVYQGC